MRKLLLAAIVALVGVAPVGGFAQTPAAPAPAAAQATSHSDDTSRVLTIGLGAVTGMVMLSVVSTNMISGAALANLGQGALVFIGTVAGGLAGNWLYGRENPTH
jgi:hypothetical protein